MEKPINNYWLKRLTDLKAALESNNFEVFLADDKNMAHKIVLDEIIPTLKAKTISWGGSMTFIDTGLYAQLKENTEKSFPKNRVKIVLINEDMGF